MWNAEWNDKASPRWLRLTGGGNVAGEVDRNPFSPHLVRVNTHLADAPHNVYFTELMVDLFPRLSERERRLLRGLMPDLFSRLHLWDVAGVRGDLAAEGFCEQQVDTIGNESFTRDVDYDGMRRASRSSMRMLERCGFFDEASARRRFAEGRPGYLLAPAAAAAS